MGASEALSDLLFVLCDVSRRPVHLVSLEPTLDTRILPATITIPLCQLLGGRANGPPYRQIPANRSGGLAFVSGSVWGRQGMSDCKHGGVDRPYRAPGASGPSCPFLLSDAPISISGQYSQYSKRQSPHSVSSPTPARRTAEQNVAPVRPPRPIHPSPSASAMAPYIVVCDTS